MLWGQKVGDCKYRYREQAALVCHLPCFMRVGRGVLAYGSICGMAMSVAVPCDVCALGDGVERGSLAVEVLEGQC